MERGRGREWGGGGGVKIEFQTLGCPFCIPPRRPGVGEGGGHMTHPCPAGFHHCLFLVS